MSAFSSTIFETLSRKHTISKWKRPSSSAADNHSFVAVLFHVSLPLMLLLRLLRLLLILLITIAENYTFPKIGKQKFFFTHNNYVYIHTWITISKTSLFTTANSSCNIKLLAYDEAAGHNLPHHMYVRTLSPLYAPDEWTFRVFYVGDSIFSFLHNIDFMDK